MEDKRHCNAQTRKDWIYFYICGDMGTSKWRSDPGRRTLAMAGSLPVRTWQAAGKHSSPPLQAWHFSNTAWRRKTLPFFMARLFEHVPWDWRRRRGKEDRGGWRTGGGGLRRRKVWCSQQACHGLADLSSCPCHRLPPYSWPSVPSALLPQPPVPVCLPAVTPVPASSDSQAVPTCLPLTPATLPSLPPYLVCVLQFHVPTITTLPSLLHRIILPDFLPRQPATMWFPSMPCPADVCGQLSSSSLFCLRATALLRVVAQFPSVCVGWIDSDQKAI